MVEKIKQFVEWYESTALYRDFFSKLPEPFDDVYLETLIFLILVVSIIWMIKEKISDYRFRKRMKAKQRKLKEQHVDELLDSFKKEDQAISQILDKKTEQMKAALSEEIQNAILEGLQREPSADKKEVIATPDIPIAQNESSMNIVEDKTEAEEVQAEDVHVGDADIEISAVETAITDNVSVQKEQKSEPLPQRTRPREATAISPEELKAFIVPQRIDEPQEEEISPEEEKPIVNIADIFATKASSQETPPVSSATTSDGFNSIIEELQKKNAAKEKSKQITEKVEEVRKQNIEVLDRKIKQALTSETPVQKKSEDVRSENFSKELERRKKEALKIAERERAKQEKAQKKNGKK